MWWRSRRWPNEELRSRSEAEPSCEIRKRVNAARQIQNTRYSGRLCNAHMGPREMREYCSLSEEGEVLLHQAFDTMGLTARSYDRILRVSRTIADLDGSQQIQPEHLAEALQYHAVKIGM